MTKAQFLQRLAYDIAGLPRSAVEHWLEYYDEMLDDRIEDGMNEEEAVAALGDPAQIARQILAETPFVRLVKERLKPQKSLPVWALILLILGSPVWLSLVVAAAAVVLSLVVAAAAVMLSVFVSLWAGMLSLYAVELSLAACAVGGLGLSVVEFCVAAPLLGILFLGGALVCAGLAILALPLCKRLTVLLFKTCKSFWLCIKRLFVRKEGAQ